jgi:glycosyltransferase involved in cell wall biosynthesis
VHVINSLTGGGAETMLARLVSAPGASEFEHIVLPLLEGGMFEERFRETGALVDPLRIHGAAGLLTAPFRLARRLRRLAPDLVQGWLLQGNLAASVGESLARQHVPVLWNVRWTLYDVTTERRSTRALLWLSGRLSTNPRRIIFNSRLAVSQHSSIGFPVDKAVVIPNGFDLSRLRPDEAVRTAVRAELQIPDGALVVGMLARYHPMKDYGVSLRAAARVLERGVNAVFVYAGEDVDESNTVLMSEITQLGLQGRVWLLGERLDVERLYAAFDLYWMSSWARGIAEGFPSVLAEAMASGVPCVATDSGDAELIVGASGRVVPARDPYALGDAAAEFLETGQAHLREMGIVARQRIENEFSLPTVVDAYESLYKAVLRDAEPRSQQLRDSVKGTSPSRKRQDD